MPLQVGKQRGGVRMEGQADSDPRTAGRHQASVRTRGSLRTLTQAPSERAHAPSGRAEGPRVAQRGGASRRRPTRAGLKPER